VLLVWLFEAKFVINGRLPTLLAFFNLEKSPNEIWLFMDFIDQFNLYVCLAYSKMILADFWTQADI